MRKKGLKEVMVQAVMNLNNGAERVRVATIRFIFVRTNDKFSSRSVKQKQKSKKKNLHLESAYS